MTRSARKDSFFFEREKDQPRSALFFYFLFFRHRAAVSFLLRNLSVPLCLFFCIKGRPGAVVEAGKKKDVRSSLFSLFFCAPTDGASTTKKTLCADEIFKKKRARTHPTTGVVGEGGKERGRSWSTLGGEHIATESDGIRQIQCQHI